MNTRKEGGRYRPKPLESFSPSKDDIEYADSFVSLAHAVESSGQGEAVALRLSTCRNVYLTINSLFVELREIMGHGNMPSFLSTAINVLRRLIQQSVVTPGRGDPHADLHGVLGEIGLRLSEFRKKQSIWSRRHELDERFETGLATLKRHEADRLRRIIANSRTCSDSGESADYWDVRWFEMSQAEDGWAKERLVELSTTASVIRAIAKVVRNAALAWKHLQQASQGRETLFDTAGEQSGSGEDDPWQALHSQLTDCAGYLGLTTVSQANGQVLAWHCATRHRSCQFPAVAPTVPIAQELLGSLCDHLERCEREQYQSLSGRFRANAGRPPLPPPFKIDLSEPFAIKSPIPSLEKSLGKLRCLTFGQEAPGVIHVAVCEFGVPQDYRQARLHRYLDESHRKDVEKLARAAIDVLAEVERPVLVLPELFLPAATAETVARYARDRGVALIAGVEPTEKPMGLDNRALISLPNLGSSFEQSKARSSPYETVFSYESSSVLVFGGTAIGSFAVVVCSDYREIDLLAAIANARFLVDTLFVCSCNPQPELFETFAVADAARLYCHVVVANNHYGGANDTASADGTTVCSPMADHAKRVCTPVRHLRIALPNIGGRIPSLALYELRIDALRTDKQKPERHYMAVPHCREQIPYYDHNEDMPARELD